MTLCSPLERFWSWHPIRHVSFYVDRGGTWSRKSSVRIPCESPKVLIVCTSSPGRSKVSGTSTIKISPEAVCTAIHMYSAVGRRWIARVETGRLLKDHCLSERPGRQRVLSINSIYTLYKLYNIYVTYCIYAYLLYIKYTYCTTYVKILDTTTRWHIITT
jgi:hypothetical protein